MRDAVRDMTDLIVCYIVFFDHFDDSDSQDSETALLRGNNGQVDQVIVFTSRESKR